MNKEDLPHIIESICVELENAELKHPGFPTDCIHASSIIAEECGELIQACLQYTYEDNVMENIEKEAIQCAAMSIRFLLNLQYMKARKSNQL